MLGHREALGNLVGQVGDPALAEPDELEGADFRVLQGDVNKLVEKIGQEAVDCIVCEPDLGPALRQVPTGPYA